VFHSDVRERWNAGDPQVVAAMAAWAGYAERGRDALLGRDYATLGRLIDDNYNLRASIYRISEGNAQMISTAREAGATANFAGSGGAIVGTYEGECTYETLVSAMKPLGVAVIKPMVAP
jgi:glucuronokinase